MSIFSGEGTELFFIKRFETCKMKYPLDTFIFNIKLGLISIIYNNDLNHFKRLLFQAYCYLKVYDLNLVCS
jgi:hypothetical protein